MLAIHFFISLKPLKIYFFIDHNAFSMSEIVDTVAFVRIVWCSRRVHFHLSLHLLKAHDVNKEGDCKFMEIQNWQSCQSCAFVKNSNDECITWAHCLICAMWSVAASPSLKVAITFLTAEIWKWWFTVNINYKFM